MKQKIIKNFICNKLFSGELFMLLLQTGITIFLPKLVQTFLDAILFWKTEWNFKSWGFIFSCPVYCMQQSC